MRLWSEIIQEIDIDVWGIENLFPYQLFIIKWLVSGNIAEKERSMLCVKTGGGKSAVMLLTTKIFRGIHLVIVPLLALWGDQVEKCKQLKDHQHNLIKAVHLDEVKLPSNIHELKSFIKGMTLQHALIITACP